MRRLSISSLLMFIIIAAVGMAAIRVGSAPWAGAMFSITFFTMICSVLVASLTRGIRRVYWLGFATLGWSYLLLMFVPTLHAKVGQHLLAPHLFSYLDEVLHAEPGPGGGMQSLPLSIIAAGAIGGGFDGGTGGPSNVEDYSFFVRIGIAMEALLWAFIGGWAACYFAAERIRESEHVASAPASAG